MYKRIFYKRIFFIHLIAIFLLIIQWGCEDTQAITSDTGNGDADTDSDTDGDGDSDTDADGDGDGDSDTDADGDSDGDSDTDSDGDSDDTGEDVECVDQDGDWWCDDYDCNDSDSTIYPGADEIILNGIDEDCDGADDEEDDNGPADEHSFLWIANTGEGTLTKIATREEKEVARYATCPYDVKCDPSRTSVNLYGDMVVTGRRQDSGSPIWWGEGASMVTKFSAYEDGCIDRNNNGAIDTSTGPGDVKAWGEDECMLWSTELAGNIGARGTAWDGTEDPKTGTGGHVWVGTCDRDTDGNQTETVYVINGETGNIDEEIEITGYCLYGAASDGERIWFIDILYPTISDGASSEHFRLTSIDIETKEVETYQTPCAYGITVDASGRIWTGGYNPDMWGNHCVARFDPYAANPDEQIKRIDFPTPDGIADASWGVWMRGLSVGNEISEGFIWAAQTVGLLHKINLSSAELVQSIDIESNLFMEQSNHIIGVAIDFDGYIWVVSESENATYKVDPTTGDFIKITIGEKPYTYSDMTGVQLRNAIIIQ